VPIEGKMGPRINLHTVEKNRILSLLGIEPQSPSLSIVPSISGSEVTYRELASDVPQSLH